MVKIGLGPYSTQKDNKGRNRVLLQLCKINVLHFTKRLSCLSLSNLKHYVKGYIVNNIKKKNIKQVSFVKV